MVYTTEGDKLSFFYKANLFLMNTDNWNSLGSCFKVE